MERSLQSLNNRVFERFQHSGVRLGDKFTLKPAWGRKSAGNLKHTEIYFSSHALNIKDKRNIILPQLGEENFRVALKISKTFDVEKQAKERFYLRSLSNNPFWINGQWCFECYVERGDRIKIGPNTLEFKEDQTIENFKDGFIDDFEFDDRLVKSDMNILLEGETGTGKSMYAKKIHEKSGKRGHFVHINLSAFAPELLESELFGHVRGAFTGAINAKRGSFEGAQHGTLFLDEIDSLSEEIQTKLLLFLDNGIYRAVGSSREQKIKTRLIFAAGRSLKNLVERKEFRKDFYFRISSGVHFKIKPIRDRTDFIKKLCERYSITNKITILPSLISFYQTLPWPGNIRQLLGHLDKKRTLSKTGKLYFSELDDELVKQSSNLCDMDESMLSMSEMKEAYAKRVYFQSNNNLALSSRKLDMSRKALKRILDPAA